MSEQLNTKKDEMFDVEMEQALPKVESDNSTEEEEENEDQQHHQATADRPSINHLNILNFLFYVINIVFTYGVGNEGWFGGNTNSGLSDKYQTIVTPKGTAFAIWSIIFLFQAIFSVVNLLPRFRGTPMVQKGVGYWWIAACIMQTGWTFAFAFEQIPLSLVFMILLWICLMGLLYVQYYTESDGTMMEFWLLRFPFAVHGGWITCASAVNVNLVAVWSKASAETQLALAIVSLAVLHAIAVWVLFNIKKGPNYTIACVISYANWWIYAELQNPNQLVATTFSQTIITAISYAARAVCFIVLAQIIFRSALCGVEYIQGRKKDD